MPPYDEVATEWCTEHKGWVVDLVNTKICAACAGLTWSLRRSLAVVKKEKS